MYSLHNIFLAPWIQLVSSEVGGGSPPGAGGGPQSGPSEMQASDKKKETIRNRWKATAKKATQVGCLASARNCALQRARGKRDEHHGSHRCHNATMACQTQTDCCVVLFESRHASQASKPCALLCDPLCDPPWALLYKTRAILCGSCVATHRCSLTWPRMTSCDPRTLQPRFRIQSSRGYCPSGAAKTCSTQR